MIELIEENPRAQRFKSYMTVFAILFITFAIPVTITQYYRGSQVTSSANVVTPTKNINSYITTTMTSTISPTKSITVTPTLTATPSINASSPTVTPLLFISATPTSDTSSNISSFVSDYVTPYVPYYALILGLLILWLILIFYYFAVKRKSLSLTDQEKLPQ